MRRVALLGSVITAVFLGLGIGPDIGAARAAATCPAAPPPGTTIQGSLEVVAGTCILNNVTVTGSITIDSGGHLELDSSTVYGNVVTSGDGEFDAGALTNFNGGPNGKPSTVRGSVNLTNPADFDFKGGSIGGGVTISGASRPTFNLDWPLCGVTIGGNVSYSNLSSTIRPVVGDPDADNRFVGACAGNTIAGSVSFTNVARGATLEANHMKSGTFTNAPNSDIEDNTVNGNLTCTNTTFNEHGGNTVSGSNSC